MTREDFEVFAVELGKTAELLNEPLSEVKVLLHFEALMDLPLDAVLAALRKARATSTYCPRPAEVRALVRGDPDERAEIAWSRVHQAIHNGVGGYQPIDFGDPILHAAVTAMTGWGRFYSLGFYDTEPVTIATAKKEFIALYLIYLKRGAPASTPHALCAKAAPVFPEPQKLGDGLTEPIVPALPPATIAPAALALPQERIGPERVRELLLARTAD